MDNSDGADGDSEGGHDDEDRPNKPKRVKVECIIGDRTEEELRETNP